jgi:ABC-type Fe3+ transport system permease subunit
LRGALAATAILLFVLVSSDALLSDLLAVRTFAEEVYAEFILDPTRIGPVLSAIPMTLVLGLALLAVSRRGLAVPPAGATAPPIMLRLGPLAVPLTLGAWAAIPAAALAPLCAVGSRIESLDALVPALRAAWPSVQTSLVLGAGAATAVAAASPGLATLALARRSALLAIGAALVLLVATPAPVVGVALVQLFNRPGPLGLIYDSPAIIVIGHVVRLLPFGVALLLPAVARVPQALTDAARIDGCDWLALQRRLIWPLVRHALALAWLIVLLLSFAEVNVAKLVAPPGCETAAGLAFTLLHFGVYRDLAVLALLSTAAVCGMWSMLLAVLRLRTREC